MLVEFTDSDDHLVLVNTEKIVTVGQETESQYAYIIMDCAGMRVNVKQTFEETKKRLGLSIIPRAGTIASF